MYDKIVISTAVAVLLVSLVVIVRAARVVAATSSNVSWGDQGCGQGALVDRRLMRMGMTGWLLVVESALGVGRDNAASGCVRDMMWLLRAICKCGAVEI